MPNGAHELLEAARDGRSDETVQVLEKDPTLIQIGDPIGDTAFHVAARAGHAETVRKVIEFLECKNSQLLDNALCDKNGEGDTPLHLAVKNNHNEAAVHMILRDRRAVHMKNDEDVSPLELAEKAGNHELMRLMATEEDKQHLVPSDIEMRLSILAALSDEEEDDEWVILYKAAIKGDEEMVAELLEEDEELLHNVDDNGHNAIHVAASYGQDKTLKKMVEFMQNNSELKKLLVKVNKAGNTPLHLALGGDHVNTAQYLIKVAPTAVYKVNHQGFTALCLAVEKGFPDLIRYMTRMDQSGSVKDRLLQHAKKVSMVHIVLKKRNQDVLQAILEGLPELINSPDKKGWKPLSFAVYKGYFKEMCYILKNFPDSLRQIDGDGSLPIHKAVAGGHVNVVKEILLGFPEALHGTDKKGRNLLDIATLYQSKDVMAYLKEVTTFD